MIPKVVYPNKERKAKVGQRATHKPTGYVFEKSKNGRWSFVWEGKLAEQIAKQYGDGKSTVREIATSMGICLSTVQRFLDRRELLGAKRNLIDLGKKVVATKPKTIKRLYLSGMNIEQIAEHFGISINTIAAHIREQSYRRTAAESAAVAFKADRRNGKIHNQSATERLLSVKIEGLELERYRHAVKKMTTNVMFRFGHLIDPEKVRSPEFHVDHMFSVTDGWSKLCKASRTFEQRQHPVPLRIICHPANLRMLTNSQNVHKGGRSALTLKELEFEIAKFESLHGEVFSG